MKPAHIDDLKGSGMTPAEIERGYSIVTDEKGAGSEPATLFEQSQQGGFLGRPQGWER